MNDDKIINDAIFTAHEMKKFITKKTKRKDVEYAFKFGTYAIASLTADFVDAIVKDAHPGEQIRLMNDINHLSIILLKDKSIPKQ